MTRTTFILYLPIKHKNKCTWHTGGHDRKAARAALLITALNTKQTYVTKVISKQESLGVTLKDDGMTARRRTTSPAAVRRRHSRDARSAARHDGTMT